MLKNYRFFIVLISIVFLGCGKDKEDEFTSGTETNVTVEDISGTWFVFAGAFMDNFVEVTPNFPDCGNDHIIFGQNGGYQEVLYNKLDCIPQVNTASWKVENGIIIVSSSNETIEFPILEASSDELVINFRYDFDNDGSQDIFKAYLRPYDVLENYHITKSFRRNLEEQSLLQFDWKQETNTNAFNSYEIYRSQEGSCSKENAVQIAEINTISETSFIDYDPPATQGNLCYFLRVYSNGVLVGESGLLNEDPKDLVISTSVNLKNPIVQGESIFLEWDEYNIPYFSHYEILFSNGENPGSSAYEEGPVAVIDNRDQTTYLDNDPPFIEDPSFAIYGVNLFGKKTLSNYVSVEYRRKDLFARFFDSHFIMDDIEPILFFYGYDDSPNSAPNEAENRQLIRYNYESGAIEASFQYDYTSWDFFKPINNTSSPEGQELIFHDFGGLYFLNPESLSTESFIESSYLFEELGFSVASGFDFLRDSIWVAYDSFDFFVLRRVGSNLELIDTYSYSGFRPSEMIIINENQVLVGQYPEDSVLITINGNGEVVDSQIVTAKVKDSYYNPDTGLFFNKKNKTIYSTSTFEPMDDITSDIYPIGISADGENIFCSYNDPELFGQPFYTDTLKKEIVIYNVSEKQITSSIEVNGYPLEVLENESGGVISISAPENNNPLFTDIFIEKIEMP
jgi:hypothetical protein